MLTAIEATANCHIYDLHGEEPAETCEHCAALLVDGVETNDMDEGAGGQEYGGADRLEEEEMRALLKTEVSSGPTDRV